MPPKRKKPTKEEDGEVKAGSYVYILTKEGYDHSNYRRDEVDIIGIFNSKDAAVAVAGDVDTPYGTFDDAVKDEMFEDCHEDHRDAPPDDGVLLKIGDDDVDEGDHCELIITKTLVHDMPEPSKKKKAHPSNNKGAMNNGQWELFW